MTASAPPPSESFVELGVVRIVIGLDDDGEEKLYFTMDHVKPTAAIGYLTVVADVLRATEVQTWGTFAINRGNDEDPGDSPEGRSFGLPDEQPGDPDPPPYDPGDGGDEPNYEAWPDEWPDPPE